METETGIRFRTDMKVELTGVCGNDSRIAQAARVSTGRDGLTDSAESIVGLINYLMKHRHGSPFEHGYLQFRIECPIFVAREFMRHRIGWGYNEISGRYARLQPEFWVPDKDRGYINEGTSARPKMVQKEQPSLGYVTGTLEESYTQAWDHYQMMINSGIANEVSRSVLPVGTYTAFFASCNPRSLMHFLSLRVDHPDNRFDTYPQAEIQEIAEQMEDHFSLYYPITHSAFMKHGRIDP